MAHGCGRIARCCHGAGLEDIFRETTEDLKLRIAAIVGRV